MPATTTASYAPAARRTSFQFNPVDGQQLYNMPGEVPSQMYRDDELYTAPPANYVAQPIMQPTQAQLPAYLQPPPPAPPKPGYETGHTALIGTPIPGTETPLGAVNNDATAGTETTTAGMQNMIRDSLLNLLGQPSPTAQDPAIAGATSAYNAAQNRASARLINQNAEAFGAQGLESSGARLAADRGVIEQQGLNEGLFSSNAVLNELTQRREQMMSALQAAAAINDQDLSRRLQEQLAQLNATIQREGLSNQLTLGNADIDLRKKLGMGGLNVNLLGLAQQGRQFNDSLGADLAKFQATLNNQALVNLLFGG